MEKIKFIVFLGGAFMGFGTAGAMLFSSYTPSRLLTGMVFMIWAVSSINELMEEI